MATEMKLITDITLELTGETKRYEVVAKQGDKATRFIRITLKNNGQDFEIPAGMKVIANIQKPDRKCCYNTCSYSGSTVTMELTNQALAVAGTAECDIEIRDANDEVVLSSQAFTIEIEKSMRDENAIRSSNEFTQLEQDVREYAAEYLKKNPVQPTPIDKTLTKENEAADAEKTGEEIKKRATISGWKAARIIGTDEIGDMTEKDIEQIDVNNIVFAANGGKKYAVSINEEGKLEIKEAYRIPSEGLITDLMVKRGICMNVITKEEYDSFTVNEDGTFYGDTGKYGTHGGTNIIEKALTNRSIVCLIDTSDIDDTEVNSQMSFIMGDNFGYHGIEFRSRIIKNSSQMYFRDYGGVFGYADTKFNNLNNNALLGSKNDYYPYEKNNIFMAISCDDDNKKMIKASFNGILTYNYSENANERNGVYVLRKEDTKVKIKRILIYERALSEDEIISIRNALVGTYCKVLNSNTWIDGIEGLGSPTAFSCSSPLTGDFPKAVETKTELGDASIEINGEVKNYKNAAWEEPEIEETPTKFKDVFFTNPIESIDISQIYKLEAFPYPYKIDDNEYTYNIEYKSSNAEVCLCYNGLLIPKKLGTVTITAKISKTAIQKQIDIQVISASKDDKNYMYIDENYSNEYGTLKSKNPVQLLKMIFRCIDNAKELGFNGIVFPKMKYCVAPYKTGVLYYVPSNMTIDFNGASFYVQDNEFCKVDRENKTQKYYTMFSFGKSTWGDQEDGLYKQCENSTIKNLKYYGERYETSCEDEEYSEFNNAFYFSGGGTKKCHLENIYFHSTIGFNISTGHNGFQMWQGTSNDGAARGCVLEKDLSPGRLNETGEEIINDDTGMWYCTPDHIKLGYTYSENPKVYTDMKYYTFGTMGAATRQGSSGFWYDIYFYDSEKSLIEYRPYQMTLEKYLLPQNAVYFKVNTAIWGNIKNSSTDVPHVQRLWNEGSPYMCSIRKCQFINPHASAISMTGGDSFVIEDCYAEQGADFKNINGAGFGWSIDFEDGWLNMRHCIVYKLLCTGLAANPGGYDTVYANSVIKSLTSVGSAQENINVINSYIDSLSCKAKINDYYNSVSYTTKFETEIGSDVTIARSRVSNCKKIESIKIFE